MYELLTVDKKVKLTCPYHQTVIVLRDLNMSRLQKLS